MGASQPSLPLDFTPDVTKRHTLPDTGTFHLAWEIVQHLPFPIHSSTRYITQFLNHQEYPLSSIPSQTSICRWTPVARSACFVRTSGDAWLPWIMFLSHPMQEHFCQESCTTLHLTWKISHHSLIPKDDETVTKFDFCFSERVYTQLPTPRFLFAGGHSVAPVLSSQLTPNQ